MKADEKTGSLSRIVSDRKCAWVAGYSEESDAESRCPCHVEEMQNGAKYKMRSNLD